MNSIFTNDRLYYWRKVESQICEYCNAQKQTVTHLIIDCLAIRSVWIELHRYVCQRISTPMSEMDFSCKRIILNDVHPKPGHITNLLVLLTKQHIYTCKCLGKQIKFQEIK